MPRCAECATLLAPEGRFCPECGAARPGVEARKLFLEDLFHHCARCGKEERFGKLAKCAACIDYCCATCVKTCGECGEPACLKCLLDCVECNKTGCTRCFDRCEACRSVAMCPEHALACQDCGFSTCESCLRYCASCELEVCTPCREEAHDKEKRVKGKGG